MNFCLTHNLNEIITQPTRVTDSTISLIDIILVSSTK